MARIRIDTIKNLLGDGDVDNETHIEWDDELNDFVWIEVLEGEIILEDVPTFHPKVRSKYEARRDEIIKLRNARYPAGQEVL